MIHALWNVAASSSQDTLTSAPHLDDGRLAAEQSARAAARDLAAARMQQRHQRRDGAGLPRRMRVQGHLRRETLAVTDRHQLASGVSSP